MKSFFEKRNVLQALTAIAVTAMLPMLTHAQFILPWESISPPPGETIVETYDCELTPGHVERVSVTAHNIYFESRTIYFSKWEDDDSNFKAGMTINDIPRTCELVARVKKEVKPFVYFYYIYDCGLVVREQWTPDNYLGNALVLSQALNKYEPGATYRDIVGDDIYVLSSNNVFVTRDSNMTWQIDTNGLNNASLNGIALDSSQNVFVATSNGIYQQDLKGGTWSQLASYGKTNTNNIFIDRRQRMFVSGSYPVSLSTDGGTTWQPDTAGLNASFMLIKSFGDDPDGNVYLSSTYPVNGLYRSTGGTGAWTRIDGFLTNPNYGAPSTPLIKSIGGDSILLAGTQYGLFESSDQGTTWTESDQNIRAEVFFGFAKMPSGKIITSTNSGVFGKQPSDTSWQKLYPKQGYFGGQPLWCDAAGTLYTQGAIIDPNYAPGVHTPLKSADDGATWTPDTLGIATANKGGIIPDGKYFVDKSGTQYIFYGYSWPSLFIKRPGMPWKADTSGVSQPQYIDGTGFGFDYSGNLYLAYYDNGVTAIWTRQPSQATWSQMSATGISDQPVLCFAGDKSGTIFAGSANNGVYKFTGGSWHQTQLPPGQSGNGVQELSVDSSGAAFAAYGPSNSGKYAGTGVYWTTDAGVSWSPVMLDSFQVGTQTTVGLVSFGDSTYALTTDGLYILTRNSSSSVSEPQPLSEASSVYPNPFRDQTTLSYQLQNDSRVEIDVLNMLGETVEKVFTGMQPTGNYTIPIDGAQFSSGIYFCKITVNGKVSLHPIAAVK